MNSPGNVPAEAAGLRRLYSNTGGLSAEEENNVMSVSTGWSVGVHLDIQVPANIQLSPPSRTPSLRFGGLGPHPIEIGRTLTGTINGGGPDFNLRTFSGNIYLRKAKQ